MSMGRVLASSEVPVRRPPAIPIPRSESQTAVLSAFVRSTNQTPVEINAGSSSSRTPFAAASLAYGVNALPGQRA